MNEDGLKNLAIAIVTKAVSDYKGLLKKREKQKIRIYELDSFCETDKHKIFKIKRSIEKIDNDLKDIEDFFRSEWCSRLCGGIISGEDIIKELKKVTEGGG